MLILLQDGIFPPYAVIKSKGGSEGIKAEEQSVEKSKIVIVTGRKVRYTFKGIN